jgi:paraquat-inducible protein B
MEKNIDSNMNAATEKIKNFGSVLEKGAQSAKEGISSGVNAVASTIKNSIPKDGVLSSAAAEVAQTLESSGRYISEHKVSDMAEDFTILIRKNPGVSIISAVALGFIFGRAVSR